MLSKLNVEKNIFIGRKRTRMNQNRVQGKSEKSSRKSSKKETKLNKLKKFRVKSPKIKKGIPKITLQQAIIQYATEEDFKNPIVYFESLWNSNIPSTGIIKIIPPKSWQKLNSYIFNEKYLKSFLKYTKKIETREQILSSLMKGKKFNFHRKYNFTEYRDMANVKEAELYPNMNEVTIETKEEDFWKFCNDPSKTELKVQYAADMSYETFFGKNDIQIEDEFLKTSWNLSSIFKEKDSFFQFLKEKPYHHISGLSQPWLYFGMIFSTFCWHVEDLYMYSLNYMHHGSPKIWYSVPHNEKEKLDKLMKSKIKNLQLDENIFYKLILLIDPIELLRNGITVYKTIQNPGELIFTLPKAYHCGFSTGFNISEAVNLASYKWLKYGFEACNDYQKSLNKIPVFSIEWLLQNNINHITKYEFTNKSELNSVISSYQDLIYQERIKRRDMEKFLEKNKLSFQFYIIKPNEGYSKHECGECTNYGYFSYKKCMICDYKTCLDHFYSCKCKIPIVMIYYRNIDDQFLEKIEN